MSGTHDARQPHPVSASDPEDRQGLGSENEPIAIEVEPQTYSELCCWKLCESGIEEVDTSCTDPLDSNFVVSATDIGAGRYELVLGRPISAGHWTTITHLGTGDFTHYASLPANVNADGTANSTDVLRLIDYYNGTLQSPYGIYSEDIDHSGLFAPADIQRVTDLLNGGGCFIPWNGVALALDTCAEDESGDGFDGGFDENAQLADWFVGYLSGVVIDTDSEAADFDVITGELAEWCVDHFSTDERQSLVDRLSDPELTFASDYAEAAVAGIVELLTP